MYVHGKSKGIQQQAIQFCPTFWYIDQQLPQLRHSHKLEHVFVNFEFQITMSQPIYLGQPFVNSVVK